MMGKDRMEYKSSESNGARDRELLAQVKESALLPPANLCCLLHSELELIY